MNRTDHWLNELKSYAAVVGTGILTAVIATFGCLPRPESRLRDNGGSSHLFISLNNPVSGSQNQFRLVFGAPASVSNVGYCTSGAPSDCKPGSSNYTTANLIYNDNTTKFFNPGSPTTLTDNGSMILVASDGSNRVTDQRTVVFHSTGS